MTNENTLRKWCISKIVYNYLVKLLKAITTWIFKNRLNCKFMHTKSLIKVINHEFKFKNFKCCLDLNQILMNNNCFMKPLVFKGF